MEHNNPVIPNRNGFRGIVYNRVADPGGVNPDPDPTPEKKDGSDLTAKIIIIFQIRIRIRPKHTEQAGSGSYTLVYTVQRVREAAK